MTKYRCDVCNVFEYDDTRGNSITGIKPGTKPEDFPDDWKCPICASDKSHLKPVKEISTAKMDLGGYLAEWKRERDDLEIYMADIHTISVTGEAIIEPMRTRKNVISWDDILIKGAQLAKIPLNKDEPVNTRTIIGPAAKHPLIIETPIYVTHMSFGALSKEVKTALAKGSAAVRTAMGSGEGGILKESLDNVYKYIFEYVPNRL